ncbi:MAG: response regulator [Rhodocyclaceae bacterium]|nr:response regulator [Rhodocyclaceae bacterium]MDZ4214906.1 response regulator [Rhodocyclaceae bacterium]
MSTPVRSLKQRITRTFVFFVGGMMAVVTVAVALLLGWQIERDLGMRLQERARHDATLLSQRLATLIENTQTLAKNSLVINGMTDAQGRATYLPKLADNFAATRDVHDLALVDFDGQAIFSTLTMPASHADLAYLRRAMALGSPVVYLDSAQNHLVVIAPIEYYKTTLGALVVNFDINVLAKRALDGDLTYAYRLLAAGRPLFVLNHDDGADYLVAARRLMDEAGANALEPLDLSIEVGANKDSYLRPVRTTTLNVAVLGGVLMILAGLLAARLGRSVADPIVRLCTKVAQADGSQERRCAPVGTGDELEDLARLFDERTDELLAIQASLEQRVQERTALLSSAQEIAQLGNWRWDIGSGRLEWSDEIFRLFGAEPQAFQPTYEGFIGYVHPQDRATLDAVVQKSLETKSEYSIEHRIRHADGEVRLVHERGRVELGEDGQPQAMIGTIQDITERKRAEQDLDLYRLMIEKSGDPVFLIDDDDGCRMIYVNEAAERHFGAPRAEIISWRIPDWDPSFSYADLSRHVEEIKQIGNLTIESVHRVKSGALVPVEITLNRIEYKGHLCHFGYFKNIAARKLDEQSMHGSRKVLGEIAAGYPLDQVLGSIIEFSESAAPGALGSILLVDAENRRLRLGAAPHLPTDYNAKIDGLGYADGIGSCGTAAATGREVVVADITTHPYWADFRGIAAAAGLRACWSVPAISEDGKVVATVAIYYAEPRTPTERELDQMRIAANLTAIALTRDRREKELFHAKDLAEAASQTKSNFLANMSHEIRTPMNAIIGLSHLSLQTDLSAKQRDYTEKVHASAKTLLGIINDILDVSKIEAGKLEMEEIRFELEDVVGNTATLLTTRAEEKGLDLLIDIALDVPPHLIGDPTRLGQVLLNLMGNAVKFTEHGEIVLRVETLEEQADAARLKFSIIDTGIGMSAAQIEKLFRPFTQGDASITRKYGGTGLGLTISKRLVDMMEGQIQLDSVPGAGSTFSFTARFGKPVDQPEHCCTPAPDLRGLHALAVDDSESARDILESYLQSFTFKVATATDGAAALAAIESADRGGTPFDLVVLDWKMPGLDGIETARRLRAMDGLGKVPRILLISSSGRSEMRRHLGDVAVDGLLAKPFHQSGLFNAVMACFGQADETRHYAVGGIDVALLAKLGGAHLLLVEDNEINQQVAREILEQGGITVMVADNGREALDRLATESFDGVLMDMQMPVMDGIEATRAIRRQAKFKDLPIIAMTANAMASDEASCLAAGMNAHVPKPIDPDHLFGVLAQWVTPAHPAVLPAPTFTSAGANEALPILPGVDVATSVRRLGGNVSAYYDLIGKFRERQRNAVAEIRAALDAGEQATAVRLAHTLKGLAATLGAQALRQEAATLEQCLGSAEERAAAESSLAVVAGQLGELLSVIDVALANRPAAQKTAPAMSAAELRPLFARALAQLEAFDASIDQTMTELRRVEPLPAELATLFIAASKLVAAYDYEGALEKLRAGQSILDALHEDA